METEFDNVLMHVITRRLSMFMCICQVTKIHLELEIKFKLSDLMMTYTLHWKLILESCDLINLFISLY